MIEINLARQIQISTPSKSYPELHYWLIFGLICLGIGTASWWWTHSKQQELEYLLQERMIQDQSVSKTQETLMQMERYEGEIKLLMASYQEIQEQEARKKWPVTLLDGVTQSLSGLQIWLDRVEMKKQTVELRGQSLDLQDIGKYMDALENSQVITTLQVVEILDQENGRKNPFSFFIRFTWSQKERA